MKTKPKALPLDPPATEAELDRASQIWTAAQGVMVARGFVRHLWGNQQAAGHEFVVLMLRAEKAEAELAKVIEDFDERSAENSEYHNVRAELYQCQSELASVRSGYHALRARNAELEQKLADEESGYFAKLAEVSTKAHQAEQRNSELEKSPDGVQVLRVIGERDAAEQRNAVLEAALKRLLDKHCLVLRCETGHPCPESISTLQEFFALTRAAIDAAIGGAK